MAKIVVTDYTFDSLDLERKIIESAGHELIGANCQTQQELIDLCCDADVVITQFAKVDESVVESMQHAKAIVRYGIGYDNVAFVKAAECGVPVCNIPDYCIDEVADHTLAFFLLVNSWGFALNSFGIPTTSDLVLGNPLGIL